MIPTIRVTRTLFLGFKRGAEAFCVKVRDISKFLRIIVLKLYGLVKYISPGSQVVS